MAELDRQEAALLAELERVRALKQLIVPRKPYTMSEAALAARKKGLERIKKKREVHKIFEENSRTS